MIFWSVKMHRVSCRTWECAANGQGSGVAAIEMVQNHHGLADDYNLILLDWKMPGMDGIETAREIRKVVGDDVTIIMTAYDWSQIEKSARAASVNMFMQKPLFQSTLLSAFRKIYGSVIENRSGKAGVSSGGQTCPVSGGSPTEY